MIAAISAWRSDNSGRHIGMPQKQYRTNFPVQCGCNAHVASGFFCVKIIFDNVDFQMFLTQILYLNSKRVKIGGEQELSTSQAAKDLELTPTSISRASKQLEEMGLLHIKKEGVPQFYRFSHPITNQYPVMIELFTRKLDAIQLPEDADERVEEAREECGRNYGGLGSCQKMSI